jgi:hypothetical protein
MLPASPAQKRSPLIIMTAPLGEKTQADVVPGFIPGYDADLPKVALSADLLDCVRRAIGMS